jgi:hypothetical protein
VKFALGGLDFSLKILAEPRRKFCIFAIFVCKFPKFQSVNLQTEIHVCKGGTLATRFSLFLQASVPEETFLISLDRCDIHV